MCITANAPLHDLNKIQLLRVCFSFGTYQEAIVRYVRERPHIPRKQGQASVEGDQLYVGLVAVLTRESQLLKTIVLPSQHSLEALRNPASAFAATDTKPSTTANTQRPSGWYCWGHGHCGHDSIKCKQPVPGHQPTVTKAQPMGGATYQWVKLSEAKRKLVLKNGPAGISA
jgi:hypothetical protein